MIAKAELTKNEKIIEGILMIVLGILMPTFSAFLIFNACPYPGDMTFALPLPLVNAGCPGDFIGQLGLCIFSLPFLMGFSLTLVVETLLFIAFNLNGAPFPSFVAYIPFILAYIVGCALNTLFYWLILRAFFHIRQRIKARIFVEEKTET